jgi:hypothetical protein
MINEKHSVTWWLLDYIYNKPKLKVEVDEYLDDGYKIDAIKLLRHEVLTYHKSMKYTLRNLSDAIDTYYNRFLLSKKLNKLVGRIEGWATANDWEHPKYYDKIDLQPLNLFTDWELVSKHSKLIVSNYYSDYDWLPTRDEFKQYNVLWRKYKW